MKNLTTIVYTFEDLIHQDCKDCLGRDQRTRFSLCFLDSDNMTLLIGVNFNKYAGQIDRQTGTIA